MHLCLAPRRAASTAALLFAGLLWPAATEANHSAVMPFIGVFSESEAGCTVMRTGQIDGMTDADAAKYGIVEITFDSLDWAFETATRECVYDHDDTRRITNGVRIRATCEGGGKRWEEQLTLTRQGPASIEVQFQNGFWYGGKRAVLVQCR